MAGIVTLLAGYPDDVLGRLTNPVSGLPGKYKFLPSLAEIKEIADLWDYPRQRAIAQSEQQYPSIEMERAKRPTYDELKAKYGPNWGITNPDKKDKPSGSDSLLPSAVKAKFNISDAAWDAIPDHPVTFFQKLKGPLPL